MARYADPLTCRPRRRSRTATILSGMPLRIDPQVDTKLKSLTDALGETEEAPVGDVEARRRSGHRMMDYIAATAEPVDGSARPDAPMMLDVAL